MSIKIGGTATSTAPKVLTTAYTILPTDVSLIVNSASAVTLTLPAASSCPGRVLFIKSVNIGGVVSATSNIAPLSSLIPSTAILTAILGKYATLVSDGVQWDIMNSN